MNIDKLLVVVDMQNDFIDGSLGTKEAQEIVPKVVEKIINFDGIIVATMDTHEEDYLSTQEGKNLPVKHCICGEDGWRLNQEVGDVLSNNISIDNNKDKSILPDGMYRKSTFGSLDLALADLTVTEVKAIGKVLGLPTELIEKIPTDGLCGKTDEDNLGFTYEVLDEYIRTGECKDKAVRQIIDEMHEKNVFKLAPMPKFISGMWIEAGMELDD